MGTRTKTNTCYKLAVQQGEGAWVHLGDFDSEEAAMEAAKEWTKDHEDNSMSWNGDLHPDHYVTRPARPRRKARRLSTKPA